MCSLNIIKKKRHSSHIQPNRSNRPSTARKREPKVQNVFSNTWTPIGFYFFPFFFPQVMAFLAVRLMGHSDNNWFYNIRVSKAPPPTTTTKPPAPNSPRGGEGGSGRGKGGVGGGGVGEKQGKDKGEKGGLGPKVLSSTPWRPRVIGPDGAISGVGTMAVSFTGRVQGSQVCVACKF
jgi:hypothetical protein